MQHDAMPKPARKMLKQLEVAVMFEPSRLAQDCLQAAYAHLIPMNKEGETKRSAKAFQSRLGEQDRRISARRGAKRAAAVSRSIPVLFYHMVKTGESYHEKGTDYFLTSHEFPFPPAPAS